MATPITHIILTDSIYKKFFSDCSKKDFILWTILPDIRYLDKTISREQYHIKDVSLEAVLSQKDCFQKWIYFHSLVDQIRNNFYISKWIYTFWWDEDFIMALKLFEDQYLYNKIKRRDEYMKLFNNIPYEKTPDIKKKSLDTRYTMIKVWLIEKPNNTTRRTFQKQLGLSRKYTKKINDIISKIEKDEMLLHIIDELYESFKKLIQK